MLHLLISSKVASSFLGLCGKEWQVGLATSPESVSSPTLWQKRGKSAPTALAITPHAFQIQLCMFLMNPVG